MTTLPKHGLINESVRYLNLVYLDKLDVLLPDPDDGIWITLDMMAEIYVLAERLQDVQAKNSLVRSMDEMSEEQVPCASTIAKIYAGTTSGTMLRKLMVEMHRHLESFSISCCVDPACIYPMEFLEDLIAALIVDKKADVPDRDYENFLETIEAAPCKEK
ncbi:hypothetical protein M011DRAFT_454701 [Sporormia fimetaria CBS 119925]|uniref:Uncharacterized protein n=1 Tax=Sporormia fimetaria CBS 119925 TaxID=1340428 RepID=A0A6A6VMN6_9PLEO|nr:hypothetical protein M011DRAFT_454701 [Sporormia fimetaria CBS 119925]